MERCLVTGGAGFIGSHLVENLVKQGHSVRVLDNFETGSRANLSEWQKDIEIVAGSVEDIDTVKRVVKGIDWIFHEAARVSVPQSIEDPAGTHSVNSSGTLNILIAARNAGVKRIVCASSCAVYGNAPELPKREDMQPSPQSPYAVTKLALEHYCNMFFNLYGVEAVSLRYFNIFGPRQNPLAQYAAVVPIFVRNMLQHKPSIIYGDGEQTRDFVFVQDCVQANLLAAKSSDSPGNVYNVGSANQISVNQLFSMLQKITGCEISAVYEAGRMGEVLHSCSDTSRARKHLNFQPKFDLEKGLELTVDWYQRNSA
jgi:UDP-N-acetylglucosamine/UDP-N-acetyl-alpha-D-glucosaminouronate 4-epimerase